MNKIIVFVFIFFGTILLSGCVDRRDVLMLPCDLNCLDCNDTFVAIRDSNNISWLDPVVIANPPWGAGSGLDTNWQTSYPLFDANMALRYVKQVDGNLWYVKISDSNNPSWLDYTVIANPPWGAGSSMDTNWQTSYPLFDANMALRYVKQTDGNAWYVKQSDGNIWYITQTDGNLWYSKLNDSNNTGRLDWGVIANPPVTGNYWDSNVNQTGLNGNKTGTFDLVTNGVIGAGYYQSTVGTGTAPFFISSTTNVIDLNADMVDGLHGTDINGALLRFLLNTDVNKVYVRQVDGNQWYILVSDKNNYGTYNIRAIADLNLQYYSQLDANRILYKQTDVNTIFSKITDVNGADILRLLISDTNNIGRINYKTIADLNNAYYSQLDANRILYKQTDVNTIFSKITDVNGAINLRAKSTDINGTYLNALIGGTVAKDLNITTGANRGISIRSDTNRICFPAITCEMYIDYNGTAFILGS